MSLSTLERGNFPETRQWNHSRIVGAGLPLVTNGSFDSDGVKICGLKTRNGNNFPEIGVFVAASLKSGVIILHKHATDKNEKGTEPDFDLRIAQFSYSDTSLSTKSDVFLRRLTDTFNPRDRGLGFGSALATLSEKFLITKAPLIARFMQCERVWAVAYDSSETGWSTEVLKKLGYQNVNYLIDDPFNLKQVVPSRYFVKQLF